MSSAHASILSLRSPVFQHKGGGRRRRHSSSASDEGHTSPRSLADNAVTSSADDESEGVGEATSCTCQSEQQVIPTTREDRSEMLNSDDDEPGHVDETLAESESGKSSTNDWKETSGFIEKTKCAFDFENRMVFDLDE